MGRHAWTTNNNTDSSGRFVFDGTITKNQMADFLLGLPVSFSQSSLQREIGRYYVPAFYAQDNWKVTRRLTLNLGLRWEIFMPWRSDDGALVLFKPGVQSRTFPTAPAGMVYQNDPQYDYNTDGLNLGPRIGFAWDVFGNGRTSVRGGYAVSYDGAVAEGFVATNQPFTLQRTESNPGPLSNPYANSRNPFPYNVDPSAARFDLPASMDGNMVTPFRAAYTQNLSLILQRQWRTNWMAQAAYIGNLGRRLQARSEANPAVYIPGTDSKGAALSTTRNTDARRLYAPLYSGLGAVKFDNNSSYHGLQTMIVKRLSQGFTLVAHYTWSKAIDDVCTADSRGNCRLQNPSNRRADRALGDYDRRHVAVFSYLYQPLLFRDSNRLLKMALGGWRLAGITSLRAGSPLPILTGRDVSLTGIGYDRPDLLGDPKLPRDRSKDAKLIRWFDTTAFRENQAGRFGNAGRNIVIGPCNWNLDLSVQKEFKVSERQKMEFRTDFFNLFNHANLNDPGTSLSSPQSFGKITGTGDARVIQFALRYEF